MINMIPPARNYSFYSGFKNRRTRHKLEEINLPAITRYNEQSTENIRFQKTNIRSLSPSLPVSTQIFIRAQFIDTGDDASPAATGTHVAHGPVTGRPFVAREAAQPEQATITA